ncbi:redoxin family protein [Sphingomonas piscis]|uniref:Redoxin family protein n=1 Tax=Sphingomonas piscis TaxID=2714943 RepID=A0A6G7YSW1_9SPHN|nr:redoxin family protein [Sphingomonas piscis]QIK79822.1 redoxin family protein [Sphingomonas piscis]
MSRLVRFTPLLLGVAILLVFVWRLSVPAETVIRSRLVGQPLPQFALPAAIPEKIGLQSSDLRGGQPRLLNIFASWCVPCIAEAPVLGALHRRGVRIDAIAIRDRPEDVRAFLAASGDPYQRIGSDTESRVQMALGSSGVPESFVVDGRGVIRFHQVGPINEADLPTILAELEKAR